MNDNETKELPTTDAATFDEMLHIGWQPIGNDLMACAEIGCTVIHGFSSKLANEHLFTIHKKTPGHPGRCVAQGIFDMKAEDARAVFYAMFRAACRCVYRKHVHSARHNKKVKEARKARRAARKGA